MIFKFVIKSVILKCDSLIKLVFWNDTVFQTPRNKTLFMLKPPSSLRTFNSIACPLSLQIPVSENGSSEDDSSWNRRCPKRCAAFRFARCQERYRWISSSRIRLSIRNISLFFINFFNALFGCQETEGSDFSLIGSLANLMLSFPLFSPKPNGDLVIVAYIKSPLEFIYVLIMDQQREIQEGMKRKILANTYGTAFPLKMDLDAQILSRYEFEVPVSWRVFLFVLILEKDLWFWL